MSNLTYQQRAEHCRHPLTKRLFNLMANKQTNLALSADVTRKAELLQLAEQVGPEICVLKTHIDIVEDFDADLITQLKTLASKHQFLLFEDRKFADIGNTVQLQYRSGVYHIADWADMVNAHILPGPGIIEGLKSVGLPQQRGLLLLAEMSSTGNLLDTAYVKATIAMAQQHKDFVIGFIAQHKLCDDPDFIYLTPGVNLSEGSGDQLKQSYSHPTTVIGKRGSDIIIVGRAIYHAESPRQAAQKFRDLGWQAYQERCTMRDL
jgi:uridine monophosphate synthetase